VQRETRFTIDAILEMDDDQLLFWYSGGKSAADGKPRGAAVSVKLDPKKSWADNLAEIARRKAEWEAANDGKNR
jgi:hypothetical protein